jgi:exopolyphosphatase/guanosine-5'-triphosphate,3'-diphosphate pyrophosphatase
MAPYATIDIGTNSVLLLVADRDARGRFRAIEERAEITRLGRGVDKTKRLSPEGIGETVRVLAEFAAAARSLGVEGIAVSATSAARDASNGAEFLREAEARAGVKVEIISGDLEASLSYRAAVEDFGDATPMVVIDVGGGSTELVYGQAGQVDFRKSFDVGSVRLTERYVSSDPISPADQEKVRGHLGAVFSALPKPRPETTVIGIAGTVTTLFAVQHSVEPYDAARVQGGTLQLTDLRSLRAHLCSLPLAERKRLPGLQPKRADVICAGALILETALERLGAAECRVSDRGLRWGLLMHRFGSRP